MKTITNNRVLWGLLSFKTWNMICTNRQHWPYNCWCDIKRCMSIGGAEVIWRIFPDQWGYLVIQYSCVNIFYRLSRKLKKLFKIIYFIYYLWRKWKKKTVNKFQSMYYRETNTLLELQMANCQKQNRADRRVRFSVCCFWSALSFVTRPGFNQHVQTYN
jgi:hypothetical protein